MVRVTPSIEKPRNAICPICENKIPVGHRSGNGCSWCDHVSSCEPCQKHQRSPDRHLDCVQAANQGKYVR